MKRGLKGGMAHAVKGRRIVPEPSPLHRGRLWNNATTFDGVSHTTFQSPLHRGRLWNRSLTPALSMDYSSIVRDFCEKAPLAQKQGRFAKNQAGHASSLSLKDIPTVVSELALGTSASNLC